jgi:hypothetical protein
MGSNIILGLAEEYEHMGYIRHAKPMAFPHMEAVPHYQI